MALFGRRRREEKQAEQAAAPAVQAGIDPEIVAVISAAVAAMLGAGATVVGIRRAARRKDPSRSAWRNAGLLDSTRPF